MTEFNPYADVEGAVRTWLRAHPVVRPVVNGQVHFGIPAGMKPPFIIVTRIGGGPQQGDTPLEDPRISLSCWGGSKKTAMDAVRAVTFAIQEMAMESLDDSTVGYGAQVDSVLWSPDIPSDTPRYVVDFTVTVMAKQTAA